eukprot:403351126
MFQTQDNQDSLMKLSRKEQILMKIRQDDQGKILNRSLLGGSDIFKRVEERKQLKDQELDSKKQRISDLLNRKRNYNIVTSYSKNSQLSQQIAHNLYYQGSGAQSMKNKRFTYDKGLMNQSANNGAQQTNFDGYSTGRGSVMQQQPFSQTYGAFSQIKNAERKQRAQERHLEKQNQWENTSVYLRSKVQEGTRKDSNRTSGYSLIEKQRQHAIQVKDESETKELLETKRGKSLDMQNELRAFYQNLRGSDVAYTTTQTKNPFTMIWATDPSPTRQKGKAQSFVTSVKSSQLGQYSTGFQKEDLHATHSHLKIRLAEIRFDLRQTIRQVKEILERKFGSNADNITLELRDSAEQFLQVLHNDSETLAHYGPQEGYTIHVVDAAPSSYGDLDDVSQVEKYQISEDEYNKRDDTFRKFKNERQKVDPTFMKKAGNKIPDDFQKEEADQIQEGNRCEIVMGSRRGEVKYVGKIPELAPGFWVGVQLDEPMGDSDGKVKGKQYFEVNGGNKFGMIIRPKDARFGDFPPLDDFNEDEDVI